MPENKMPILGRMMHVSDTEHYLRGNLVICAGHLEILGQ